MTLEELLEKIVALDASDLYLKSDSIPYARVNGELQALADKPIPAATVRSIVESVLDPHQLEKFFISKENNLAYTDQNNNRFRVNIYFHRGHMGIVFRRVKLQIPTVESLNMPLVLKEIVLERRGLFIISGATGSGKSTTLAAMLDHRNHTVTGHIITIEDPIEYLYQDNKSIISQREVGIDTMSFENALKNSLRQAPDVISIGEIRDLETAITALTMAETGHLVLATLHATNTYQTLERLVSMFPGEQEKQLLLVLSLNLKGILSQRLLPKKDNTGRIAATELLLCSSRVRELIRKNEISDIKEVLRRGEQAGIHSFDQSINSLFESGMISEDIAIAAAESSGEMKMKMKGFAGSLKQV